jgi:hypothetical protein
MGEKWPDTSEERKHPTAWRQQVFARVHVLCGQLALLDSNKATKCGAAERLETAWRSAACSPTLNIFNWFRVWWNGTLVEQAWLALHDAECRIVGCLTPDDAVRWWQAAAWTTFDQVPWGDLITMQAKTPDNRSRVVAAMLRAYYYKSDRTHDEERMFRNRLIRLSLTGLAGTMVLLVAGILGDLAIIASKAGAHAVVSGAWQFVLVALFGAIGAFLAGLPAMTTAPHRSPYRLVAFQLILKLSVGPVFGLLGVLAVQSGLVTNVHPFGTFGGVLLFWAAGFGATQQVLTGLVDRRAASI